MDFRPHPDAQATAGLMLLGVALVAVAGIAVGLRYLF